MPKTYRIEAQQHREIQERMKDITDIKLYKKLEVLDLRAQGYKNPEIAQITRYSENRISALVSEYARNGIGYFLEEHRKGGNNRNATDIEKAEFLEQFKELAKKGQIVSVSDIAAAYDEYFGMKHKSKSTVYYLLHKAGWRKVMPRSKHPNKASDEEIAASKKLTPEFRK